MRRRTGRPWGLELDGEHGDLKILRDGKHLATANVRPPQFLQTIGGEPVGTTVSETVRVLRYRSNLRRLVLESTQALTPVPGAADVPAAIARTFSASEALQLVEKGSRGQGIPGLRHDLHRILDHLTGCDHSGCSGKPSVADFGRQEEVA